MKIFSETKALIELEKLKTDYQDFVKSNYERRAKSCQSCETKGACCLDAHFVNVHITRLEAAAIRRTLENLSETKQIEIYKRAAAAIEKYDLKSSGDTFGKTFACPLFQMGVGCLVHSNGKPAPCISHGCYENEKDLPPENLQEEIESQIERLNKKTYGNAFNWLPLPAWLDSINPFARNSRAETRP